MYLLGSHVGMSGKDMMLGSVKTALSYGANTFMLYTGAPQNTRRKKIEELNIPAARELMKENGIETFVVHAPYIIFFFLYYQSGKYGQTGDLSDRDGFSRGRIRENRSDGIGDTCSPSGFPCGRG